MPRNDPFSVNTRLHDVFCWVQFTDPKDSAYSVEVPSGNGFIVNSPTGWLHSSSNQSPRKENNLPSRFACVSSPGCLPASLARVTTSSQLYKCIWFQKHVGVYRISLSLPLRNSISSSIVAREFRLSTDMLITPLVNCFMANIVWQLKCDWTKCQYLSVIAINHKLRSIKHNLVITQ